MEFYDAIGRMSKKSENHRIRLPKNLEPQNMESFQKKSSGQRVSLALFKVKWHQKDIVL